MDTAHNDRLRPATGLRVLAAVALVAGTLAFVARPRPAAAAVPSASTPTTLAAGAYIVDLGQATQTTGNGLKPYGLLYDLVVNRKIPVTWVFDTNKTALGAADFVAGGKTYASSAFVVPADLAGLAASTIATWKAQGVVVDGPTTAPVTVPVFARITGWPRVVLDTDNGGLVANIYAAAGIPTSSYRYALPPALTPCDDLFALPHADPTWANHGNLRAFNDSGGYVFAGCHAVSVLESIVNPADSTQRLNFLSNDGLVSYKQHKDGSGLPYTYARFGNPVLQVLGRFDAATLNGSEQIYLPAAAGWRPSTEVLVSDPNQFDVVKGFSPGPAAALAIGRGYGNPTNGQVMYEAGHDLTGNAAANIEAQRAYLNFHLVTALDRSPAVTATTPQYARPGQSVPVSAAVTGGTPGYTYRWTSTCGTFANATAATTTFTANGSGSCPVTVTVTDSCGRVSADTRVVQVINPSVAVVKSANRATALPGDPVTFTFKVTNTGDVALGPGTLTDAAFPACNQGVPALAVGASATLTCTVNAGTDDIVNVAAVAMPPPDNVNVTANSPPVLVDVIHPAISLVKETKVPAAAAGDPVTFTLTVTNTGDVGLSGVVVADSGYPACARTIGALAAGASVSFDCTTTARPDLNLNTATATGAAPVGPPVTSTDTAVAFVPAPAIEVTKTASLSVVQPGTPVTYTFTVTNTGNVPLAGVTVADPAFPGCAPLAVGSLAVHQSVQRSCTVPAPADDITNVATAQGTPPIGSPVTDASPPVTVDVIHPAVTISKAASPTVVRPGGTVTFTITVTNIGDVTLTNVTVGDPTLPGCGKVVGTLDPGSQDSHTCTTTAGSSDLHNVATATGTPPAGGGVSATSPDAVVDVQHPSIAIDKLAPPGVGRAGTDVTFTIRVTNNGDVPLTNVAVADPDFAACNNNTIGALAPGASFEYSCTVTAPSDEFTNTATAAGTAPDNSGVSDEDTAYVFIARPSIAVTKAAAPTTVRPGDQVTFTFTITNDGNVALTGVALADASFPNCDHTAIGDLAPGASVTRTCTVNALPDDFVNVAVASGDAGANHVDSVSEPVPVDVVHPALSLTKTADPATVRTGETVTYTITVTNTGDVPVTGVTVTDPAATGCAKTIGTLNPTDSTSYTCTATAGDADFANTATVTGAAPAGPPVTAADSAAVDVIHPALDVSKEYVPLSVLRGGDVVTFRITVTNTGDVSLSGVAVIDLISPACDLFIGDLGPGEARSYLCTVTAPSDRFTNTASATGIPPHGNPVSGTGTVDVFLPKPAVGIVKAASPTLVRPGDDVTFTFTVSNLGNVPLSGLGISDPLFPACDQPVGDLAVGASVDLTCTVEASADDFDNVAVVRGSLPDVDAVSPPASVDVTHPAVDIAKQADPGTAREGDTITYTIKVTNSGDVDLTNVVVSDTTVPDCGRTLPGTLTPGQSTTYTCTGTAGGGDVVNTATVTGKPPVGPDVADFATATVTVIHPSVDILKLSDVQRVDGGTDVTFNLTVTNTGDVPLTNVIVADPAIDGCDRTFPRLEPHQTETWACTVAGLQRDLANTATVRATPPFGAAVTDSGGWTVHVLHPAIAIVKTAQPTTARPGDPVKFTITVTNTGDSEVEDIVVADPLHPGCEVGSEEGVDLQPGESFSRSCDAVAGTEDMTNVATATGFSEMGHIVTDAATAAVDVVHPALLIKKEALASTVVAGSTVLFTITVTNVGDVPLDPVTVTDTAVPACAKALGRLDPGQTFAYQCSAAPATSDFVNTATATGQPAVGPPVSDSGQNAVTVHHPAMTVTKTAAPALVQAGDPVTYIFTVKNTGDVPLTGVTLSDPSFPTCDGPLPDLAVGASASVTCTVPAPADDVVNTAVAVAHPPVGPPLEVPGPPAAVDVIHPALAVAKTTTVVSVRPGDPVTFTITVTNTGDTPLAPVTVADPDFPECDHTIAGPLAPGQSASYSCRVDAPAQGFSNTVDAAGTPPAGAPITSTGGVAVGVDHPSMKVMKTATPATARPGDPVTFTITVTNTGDVPLNPVEVVDPTFPACSRGGLGPLDPGASTHYDCTVPAPQDDVDNIAVATGTPPVGPDGGATSPATPIDVVHPALDVTKTVNPAKAAAGDVVTFHVKVTNTGDVPLTAVTIADVPGPGCQRLVGDLAVGQSRTVTCQVVADGGALVNVASVVGAPAHGPPVHGFDTAGVAGAGRAPSGVPAVGIAKEALTPTLSPGADATFRITVTNTGSEPLTGVVVGDTLAPDCARTIGDMAVGAVVTYTCTMHGVSGPLVNVATVQSATVAGSTLTASDDAAVEVTHGSGVLPITGGGLILLLTAAGAWAVTTGIAARRAAGSAAPRRDD